MGRFLTRAEVGRVLGLHHDTLRRWAHAGRLVPVVFSHTCLRYRWEDVEKIVQESRWDRRKKRGPKPKPKAGGAAHAVTLAEL